MDPGDAERDPRGGAITMTDGKKLALVVLVTDAKAPYNVRGRVIAEVARAVWRAGRRRKLSPWRTPRLLRGVWSAVRANI